MKACKIEECRNLWGKTCPYPDYPFDADGAWKSPHSLEKPDGYCRYLIKDFGKYPMPPLSL